MALYPQTLEIIKGIGAIPGDTNSAELPLVSIDLLNKAAIVGLTLTQDGWSPKRAPLKSGGSFISSPVVDNRALVATAYDTVTEQMSLEISSESDDLIYAQLAILGRFAQDAQDFQSEVFQQQPVYIKRQLPNERYPLYALIYTIEFEADRGTLVTEFDPAIYDVSLTIVREAAWRLIPPGANPKLATAIIRGWKLDSTDDYDLLSNTLHLHYETISNKREWNTTQTAEVTKNYIEINADYIPGDAPALLELEYQITGGDATNAAPNIAIISRRTGRFSGTNRSGATISQYFNLNFGDATVQNDTTIAADTGAPASNNSASGQRAQCTFATLASLQTRAFWASSPSTKSFLDYVMDRGRFAVYLRARLSAAATVNVQVNIGLQPGAVLTTSLYSITTGGGPAGTGNTTYWGLYYLGTLDYGTQVKSNIAANGLGTVLSTAGQLAGNYVSLEASRTSGAGVFYMSDLILVPYDEQSLLIDFYPANNTTYPSGGSEVVIVDNTGYCTRGGQEAALDYYTFGNTVYPMAKILPVQGEFPTLLPKVANRLYFLTYNRATPNQSSINDSITVRANIVPRWYGECDL